MAGYQTAYDAYQAGQAAALENLLRGLNAQKQQSELTGADVAGNALSANATAGSPASASGMNAPTAPSGDGAPPNLMPAPNPPPVTQVPMPGAAPMSAGPMPPPPSPGQMPAAPQGASIPPISASQLQPPGQGAPPMVPMPSPAAPPAAPAGQGPASAPQAGQMGQGAQNPWWKTMAAQIKQQNPNASGRDVMAALNAMQPVMNTTNRQQLSDLHMQLAMQKLQSGQGTPEEIDFLSNEVANGNQSILTRMPAPVRLAVMEKLEQGGTSGSDAANAATTYHGKQSEAAAAGRRTGNIDVAVSGAQEIVPKALAASAGVPRSSWLLAGQMGNWLKTQSNDPALAKFQVFNLGLSREYAQAFGGTVAAQQHAQEVLGTAKDQTAYRAAASALQEEMAAAQKGGERAIQKAGSGKSSSMPAPDDGGGIQLDIPPPPDGFVVQ